MVSPSPKRNYQNHQPRSIHSPPAAKSTASRKAKAPAAHCAEMTAAKPSKAPAPRKKQPSTSSPSFPSQTAFFPSASSPSPIAATHFGRSPAPRKADKIHSLPSSPVSSVSSSSRMSLTPSPRTCFASSKCYEPPLAASLPKPPGNWIQTSSAPQPLFIGAGQSSLIGTGQSLPFASADPDSPTAAAAAAAAAMDSSQYLKLLLKVQS